MLRSNLSAVAVLVVVAGVIVSPADGQVKTPSKNPTLEQLLPTAVLYTDQLIELGEVPVVDAPPVDRETVALEDEQRILLDLPPRFAIPHPVLITPDTHGVWELVRCGVPGVSGAHLLAVVGSARKSRRWSPAGVGSSG